MGVGPRTMSLSTLCSREDVYCSLEIVLGRTMYLLGQKRKPRHIAALCSITPDTKKVPPTASRPFSPEAARMICKETDVVPVVDWPSFASHPPCIPGCATLRLFPIQPWSQV